MFHCQDCDRVVFKKEYNFYKNAIKYLHILDPQNFPIAFERISVLQVLLRTTIRINPINK